MLMWRVLLVRRGLTRCPFGLAGAQAPSSRNAIAPTRVAIVLLQSPQALDYLKHCGVGNEEAIRTFKLGFANRTLPATGVQLRERLQHVGILRRSGAEHFSGSIVTQASMRAGKSPRSTAARSTNPPPVHLYLPGPHRGVWNAPMLCPARGADLWCAGYRNATASYGVARFTADHGTLFKSGACRGSGGPEASAATHNCRQGIVV